MRERIIALAAATPVIGRQRLEPASELGFLPPTATITDDLLTGLLDLLRLLLLLGVGIPAELEVDAPDVVRLAVQQHALARVEGRVEPEPALGGEIGRHLHVGDQEAVLEDAALALQAQHGAHKIRQVFIEVTETDAISDHAITGRMQQLRERGMRIALDDFGTGQSSLARLHTLPFDKIKLDRSFVQALDNPMVQAIVRAMAQLAEAFSRTLVVEGVETSAQLGHLASLGCRMVQGYLLSRPAALADLPEAIAQQGQLTLVRLSEQVQVDAELLAQLRAANLVPGATLGIEYAEDAVQLIGSQGTVRITRDEAAQLFVAAD